MLKDELNRKTMKEFITHGAKTYAFTYDEDKIKKKAKRTKKCLIKHKLTIDSYKDALFKNKTIMTSQLTFKSDCHNVYTNEINKIALSSNDDKRLQAFDRINTYPYGTNAFKVCESEMLVKIRSEQIAGYY